jgi:hypothetical protein
MFGRVFWLIKAVIDMIFVDLGLPKKDLYLLFLEKNSHSHTSSLNKSIQIFFHLVDIYIRFC